MKSAENKVGGRIISLSGGLYEIMTDTGQRIFCPARGVFRHEKIKPIVGDCARVRFEEGAGERKVGSKATPGAFISEIMPRKSELKRPPAANIDLLFVSAASACPDPQTLNIDKLICIAEHADIEPVIVITKADLDPKSAERLANIYRACSFRVFVTSKDDPGSIGAVKAFIAGEGKDKISAFAGASGVGKSTLLGELFPTLEIKTGELSRKTMRGKQTTREVTLYPLMELIGTGGGFIADTPGFGLLDFENFDYFSLEALPYTFREFEPFLTKCRFTKCSHTKEQGCAIRAAAEEGTIPRERHESYVKLYDELKKKKEY